MRNPQRHLCKGDLSRGRVCLDCSKRDSPHHAKVTFVVVVPVTLVVVVLFALLVVVIVTLGVVVECIMRDSSHNAKVLTAVDVILLHYCQYCQCNCLLYFCIISDNQSVCSSCWNKPYPIYEVVTILRCLHLKQVCLIHLFSVINTATCSVLEFRVLHITLHHTGESIAYLKKIQ